MSARTRSVGQRREAALAASRVACATSVSGPPNEYAKEQPTQEAEPTALSALRGPIPDGNSPRLGAVGEIPRHPLAQTRQGPQGPGSEGNLHSEDLGGALRRFAELLRTTPANPDFVSWDPTPEEFEEVKRQLDADARGSKP